LKAYPFSHKHPTLGTTTQSEGMDLRDYFAGLAMQAIVSKEGDYDDHVVAKISYQMADAMLVARENKHE
jgi:hypothetical protein